MSVRREDKKELTAVVVAVVQGRAGGQILAGADAGH